LRLASADSIAAIATAPGRGAVGTVRVSGPLAGVIGRAVTGKALEARVATYTEFREASGNAIDAGIALWFPGPRSYTGEDVLELQGHGGGAVLGALLARCVELGARLAQPGEFTKRAFLNGKLDLAQAESVADLIEATTITAARSAVRSLRGEFSRRIEALGHGLMELRVLAELSLDFPEEDHVLAEDAVMERLRSIVEQLDLVQRAARQGRLLREGVQVVISGAPNVGKSSLLNRLAGEEVAIVTEIPGTTRDILRASVEIEGIPFHVVDTAGLRDTDDPVERIGVARGRDAAAQADLVLLVVDAGNPVDAKLVPGKHDVVVENKIDLHGLAPGINRDAGTLRVRVSARTGRGLELLRSVLLEAAGRTEPEQEGVYMARARHIEALTIATDQISRALEIGPSRPDLFAEELRYAQESLGGITGGPTPDELLGEIFSRFCIGK